MDVKKTSSRLGSRPSYRRKSRNQSSGYMHTILIQSIICGVIIAFAFTMRVINSDGVQGIRKDLKTAISGDTDMEGLLLSATEAFDNMTESVKTIFGGEDNTTGEEGLTLTDNNVPDSKVSDNNISENQSADFRIDEDILNQINTQEDKYLKNNSQIQN